MQLRQVRELIVLEFSPDRICTYIVSANLRNFIGVHCGPAFHVTYTFGTLLPIRALKQA